MIHFYNPFSKNQYEYASPDHFSFGRWSSYFNQVNEILKLGKPGNKILEVGPGAMVAHDVLKRFGFHTTTVDIDQTYHPDILSDVRELDLPPNSYDIIACFEILEHIPYDDFKQVMAKFHKITKKYCIISLPTFGLQLVLTLKLPKIPKIPSFNLFGKNFTLSCLLSLPIPLKKKPLPYHQWEIGRPGYPLRRIKADFIKNNFNLVKFFYVPEHPWFTFFILEKREGGVYS